MKSWIVTNEKRVNIYVIRDRKEIKDGKIIKDKLFRWRGRCVEETIDHF